MPDIQLGVGLPSVVPGASADLLLRWARGADASTFSTLGVHDRLAWDGFECLGVLNAAAAVTERIKLASLVLIAPLRPAMLIGSQAAAIQRLSQGRLTLGVGIGPRRDDYEAAGSAFGTRGRRLEGQLHEFHELWDKGLDRPGLLVGGRRATSTAAVRPAPSRPPPTAPSPPGTTPAGPAGPAWSEPATSPSAARTPRVASSSAAITASWGLSRSGSRTGS